MRIEHAGGDLIGPIAGNETIAAAAMGCRRGTFQAHDKQENSDERLANGSHAVRCSIS